ncbi:hypothetical protein M9H77_04424 [Catharanthus roseus]|uniref:Uncharacterized protein n=1 Tax=Catharanthus roseus TaxID=4058 RepID=A0ACC0CE22_CATRO|nr:hypothetical protein M9H77_04424 [Catharanthus roseus]
MVFKEKCRPFWNFGNFKFTFSHLLCEMKKLETLQDNGRSEKEGRTEPTVMIGSHPTVPDYLPATVGPHPTVPGKIVVAPILLWLVAFVAHDEIHLPCLTVKCLKLAKYQ